MSEVLKVHRQDGILEVVLDRPKANAIDAATSREMGELFCEFRDDPDLRVAIITGGGEKFFSAGWDLVASSEGEAPDSDYGPGGFAGITELKGCYKPIIAAVNGMAVGGGFELALSADLVVAAEHAQFFLPEAKVGLIADAASFRLPKRLPRALALELLWTGKRLSAEEAASWGLVNQVVPGDQLMTAARTLARQILEAAPLSVQAVKQVLEKTENLDVEECYRDMRGGQWSFYEKMLASEDAKEGSLAFVEKRSPVWKGQ
ncbi:carnitinyl-CoA dehydratase [Kiloniella laminariae]|uniref:Carnitinyl-CoA dehydratase n=1 Tax=Kiloniella laminariae TaxID=454162 RepID=A0ABT4LG43_9PROT|nr:carnitinyl-CoA dehydratase [Kiloniella laminariae]MCZ4280070.1 carnitinyl-CoA dehydratase [Kiloniella laminariae]